MMKRTFFIFSLLLLSVLAMKAQNNIIDLKGKWFFEIDVEDIGIKEKWFNKKLTGEIYLPGSMAENRKGNDVTLHTQWTASIYDSSFFYNPRLEKYRKQENLKLPFWLTPTKYYVGAAWYQKEVNIPASWKKENVFLFLERPHTETIVWINGKEVGMQNSLSIPHIFEISKFIKNGSNLISIRIDNRTKDIDVGKDSHSITDQTQGNWNGVVGRIELQCRPTTYINNIRVFPDVKSKTALVKLTVKGKSKGKITLAAVSFNGDSEHKIEPVSANFNPIGDTTNVEMRLDMGNDVRLWSEFHPELYKFTAQLKTGNQTDTKTTQFGMREFAIKDKYFYINGQKTLLRGTVENCVFPLTGYAPMDVESWERVFNICRSFGLNHMRFHSFCPPEAAFIAADLTGFYLQPEGPSWPNHGSSLGDGRPVDDYLWKEAERIIDFYGNYPSFTMFAIGNEPRGRWVAWVSKFVDYWKETDTRRVYTGASVGGSWAWQPRNQYHVKAGARGLDWSKLPESSSDYRAHIDTVSQPYVSHETGQWCVFPDFREIKRYTGVMKARNFELFREDLADRNMSDMEFDFLMASGKLQALCYKHEIEKTLRTPEYAGFQLLGLNDYTGQGTALVGVLNAFWEEKGYIDAEEFRKFCAPTVLLTRMDKFVFTNNETLNAKIEVAHFGEKVLPNQSTRWQIKDAYGKIVAKGQLPLKNIQIGNCQKIGDIKFDLSSIKKAQKLNLEVLFDCSDVSNNWDFWVYPQTLPEADTQNIYVTSEIDDRAKETLNNGGNVLFLFAGKIEKGKDVVQYMTPAFWNTSWFKMRPPHTVGTLINDNHPVFNDFPTDYYTGLQWWELIQKMQVMEITDFPPNLKPMIQPIDTWFINRKLAMLFEAKVSNGKVIVCSTDITSNWEKRPVARQLYYSIINYMNTIHFYPEVQLSLSSIEDLLKKKGESVSTHTKDAPDELKNIIR